MRVDRAREAALDALAACRRNGAWIDGALKQVLKRDGLSGRDAAFASRIAYGVMQNRIYLDRCLARCLTQRPEKLGAAAAQYSPHRRVSDPSHG